MGEDNPVENFMEKQIDETSKNDELIDWKKREREKKKILKKFDLKKKPQFYHTYYVKKKIVLKRFMYIWILKKPNFDLHTDTDFTVYGLIIDQTIYILSLFLVLKLSFGRFEERKKN